MFRGRDLIAAFLAVLLTRMAWTENYASESLSATFRLAFYNPLSTSREQGTAALVPLDVDGDGTVEALAMATRANNTGGPSSWTIEVVDLKPLHKSIHSGPQTTPFRPKVLFASQKITSTSDGVVPLKMTSGQILVKPPRHHHHYHHHHVKVKDVQDETTASDDKTRHYFCGSDWHDATNNCHQHCPGGTSAECPDGMMCYADTICDALRAHAATDNADLKLALTPGGGLPSIATLWSDGTVTLHSITADLPEGEEQHEKHRPKRHHLPPRLELRLMWRSSKILEEGDLKEYDLLMLGAEDVIMSGGKKDLGRYGMIVVGGSYSSPDRQNQETIPFVQALDSVKGDFLWEASATNTSDSSGTNFSIPQVRGSHSYARRRSGVPGVASEQPPADSGTPNCLIGYRQSLLDPTTKALPYAYWGPADVHLAASHVSRHRQRRANHKRRHGGKKGKKWSAPLMQLSKPPTQDVVRGRPNVLLSHHKGGLQVLSLKNGRPVCHVSLLDQVLYADLNHDGILDHVQVITEQNAAMVDPVKREYSDKWVTDLARRVDEASNIQKEMGFTKRLSASSRLCHILALSGMPAREELFSAAVCSTNALSRQGDHPSFNTFLKAAPPLVVERTDGRMNSGSDVVVAMNNGVVSRFQAPTGKRQWQISHQEALPTWGADASASPFLGRIDFVKASYSPWIRPVLLAGEDGMALLSSGHGRLLATTTFPQTSIGRPLLADVSGDGTTDVVVVSADAVWGYQVVVRTGGSIVFRILVGLLLVGIGIALLRNRFGQRQGVDKRSTDG